MFQLYRGQQRNIQAQCFKFCWRYFSAFSLAVQWDVGKDHPVLFVCFYVNKKIIYPYILKFQEKPCLCPRTILLLMVCAANCGVWILEQPGNSVLEFYPAFIHFIKCHYDYFGNCAAQTLAPCLYNTLYHYCICGHIFQHF